MCSVISKPGRHRKEMVKKMTSFNVIKTKCLSGWKLIIVSLGLLECLITNND